tara:strand:- start:2718 stop:3035 length:318 start_codon:yes stop_codon:yes gene_type:complete
METIEQLLEKTITLENECIEWIGAFNNGNCPVTWYQGQVRSAHRVLWTLTNGLIPQRHIIAHHCDNPKCMNIDHLLLTTHYENNKRRRQLGLKHDVLNGAKKLKV